MTGIAPATTCATSKRLAIRLHSQCPWLDLNQRPLLYQSNAPTNCATRAYADFKAVRAPCKRFKSHPRLPGLGLSVSLDGDPQTGCPAILVLTGNRSRPPVFALSRLSQARGIAKKLYAVYTGVEPALPTVTGWCSTVKLVDHMSTPAKGCPYLAFQPRSYLRVRAQEHPPVYG